MMGERCQIILPDGSTLPGDFRVVVAWPHTPRCPECGSAAPETTTKGQLAPGPDRNAARCHDCGWRGLVHEAQARSQRGQKRD